MKWTNSYRSFGLKTKRSTGLKTIEHKQTYKSADGIWHAAIDIEPDRATGRRRRLTAQGKTKAVANVRLRMKLDAYVRKGGTRPRWSAR